MQSEFLRQVLVIHPESLNVDQISNLVNERGFSCLVKTIGDSEIYASLEESSEMPLQIWVMEAITADRLEELAVLVQTFAIAQVCLVSVQVTPDDFMASIRAGACEVVKFDEIETQLELNLQKAHRRLLVIERLVHSGSYSSTKLGFQHGAARLLHDINSPLTAIQNSFEMIEMDHEVAGDELNAKEKLLSKGIEAARAISDHWHEYLHAQDHADARCDLFAAIRNAANVVFSVRPEITFEANPGSLSPSFGGTAEKRMIQGSAHSYELIFFHLFTNAIEALAEASGGIVRVDVNDQESLVQITVEDNGPGIHPDVKNTLWKDFQTTKSGQGHFGMGLGIVRYLLMTVGGSIRYADEKKLGGAAFLVELRPMPMRKPL